MADNPSRKFKFISPGVFVDEIDNSQLPDTPAAVGPLVIGRARKGPANKPVTLTSFSDFVQTFGNPVPGNQGGDVWRDGNLTAPTYGAYAAQAWLRNGSPLTYMRVLGDQASSPGANGYAGWSVPTASDDANGGGAFALVVWPSGTAAQVLTGTIAATFYCNKGRVFLSGAAGGPLVGSSTGLGTGISGSTLRKIPKTSEVKLYITPAETGVPGDSGKAKAATVSLDTSGETYLRRALNTNPTITNTAITEGSTRKYWQGGNYWLGESYAYSLAAAGSSSIGVLGRDQVGVALSQSFLGAILPMAVGTNGPAYANQQSDHKGAATRATTGWFISQDLTTNYATYTPRSQQKLFRLEALTAGEWAQKDIKISISNIKQAEGDYQEYGTFSVLIRSISDTDNNPQIIERYDNLNLNPASPNYIAAVIGDKYETYNASTKRNIEYGQFDNQSNYVRVVMDEDVAAGGGERRWLPFGVFGPHKYRDVALASGSLGWSNTSGSIGATQLGRTARTMLVGGQGTEFEAGGHANANNQILQLSSNTAKDQRTGQILRVTMPSVPLRQRSTWGDPRNTKNTYWGAWTGRTATDTFFNGDILDCIRPMAFSVSSAGESANPSSTAHDVADVTFESGSTDPIVVSWVFSLDNVSGSLSAGWGYNRLYRADGRSISAASGTYTAVLDAGIDRFTTVLAGGSDGYDVTEADPFRNSGITATETKDSSALYSLDKAINIVSDPDYVQMNAVSIPGVWKSQVTNRLLDVAEDRADALALVDIEYAYTPAHEGTGNAATRNAGNTPTQAASTLAARSINNSYGAAYYPWVRILDTNTNQTLWAPPSVAAMGVLSNTDRVQAPWFAPAGFTRGGLSEGAAGIPVVDVSQRLTSDDRDTLYERNINPIAKFPAEGIVVFGQKTLQQTASALDRINVRRLMIYLKREISFIASRLLFGPNNQDTWDRFLGQATPLLESVKAEFGIEDFRLVLDASTTTPDLIDRNIIYAKLLVKPTRAVEFFAIDFVVTNSGASFED